MPDSGAPDSSRDPPDTTIVTQRLRHQRQLRLLVAMNGDTGGVNLNVRRICKVSTLTIALNGCRTVTTHSVCREEISVTITTSSNHHSVSAETLQLTSNKVLGNNTTSATINDDHILHLITGVELHLTSLYLARE